MYYILYICILVQMRTGSWGKSSSAGTEVVWCSRAAVLIPRDPLGRGRGALLSGSVGEEMVSFVYVVVNIYTRNQCFIMEEKGKRKKGVRGRRRRRRRGRRLEM